jgi:hypothetical protein
MASLEPATTTADDDAAVAASSSSTTNAALPKVLVLGGLGMVGR